MSLLIAYIDKSIQFLLTDRRFVDANNHKKFDDSNYKCFLYANRRLNYQITVGFIGLAKYKSFYTLDFIMMNMKNIFIESIDLFSAIYNFSLEISNKIEELNINEKYRALTIVFTGRYDTNFGSTNNQNYIPVLAIVSNQINNKGEQTSSTSREFKAIKWTCPNKRSHVFTIRGDLKTVTNNMDCYKHLKHVRRRLRRTRNNLNHEEKVNLSAKLIQKISETSNTVSNDVLGISMPVNDLIQAHDFSNNIVTKTAPHSVTSSGWVLTNIKVTQL